MAGVALTVAGSPGAVDEPATLIVLGAAGIAASAVVVWILTHQTLGRSPAETLRAVGVVRVPSGQIVRMIPLGAAISLVSALVVAPLITPPPEDVIGPLAEAAAMPGWPRWVWVALVLVLAPGLEEFLFRGVMLTGMSSSWGQRAAGIVVTLTFTALHLREAYGFLPALLPIALIGWVTYLLRYRTGSILPGLAVHVGYNGALVYLFLFLGNGL